MDLFENYIKQASKYLKEDEEDIEILDDVEEDAPVDDVPEEDDGAGGEEALELDLSNPVCPACGAELAPVDEPIDTEDEDLGLEDDEAAAIDLLQGLGYVVYKPEEEGEPAEGDDDFAGENGEDFNEDDFAEDEEIPEED